MQPYERAKKVIGYEVSNGTDVVQLTFAPGQPSETVRVFLAKELMRPAAILSRVILESDPQPVFVILEAMSAEGPWYDDPDHNDYPDADAALTAMQAEKAEFPRHYEVFFHRIVRRIEETVLGD